MGRMGEPTFWGPPPELMCATSLFQLQIRLLGSSLFEWNPLVQYGQYGGAVWMTRNQCHMRMCVGHRGCEGKGAVFAPNSQDGDKHRTCKAAVPKASSLPRGVERVCGGPDFSSDFKNYFEEVTKYVQIFPI
eukprot:853526-Pelagomonas_calceolata.AAC.5